MDYASRMSENTIEYDRKYYIYIFIIFVSVAQKEFFTQQMDSKTI